VIPERHDNADSGESAALPAEVLKYCGPNHYGEQDETATDLSLIRENLRRSPEERLVRDDEAVRGVLFLQEHARKRSQDQAAPVR
jgi:hypothetical protein